MAGARVPRRSPALERDPMIALAPRNEVSPLRLAAFDEYWQRELSSASIASDFRRSRKTHGPCVLRMRDKIVGQVLRGLRGEEARMRIGKRSSCPRIAASSRDANARDKTRRPRPTRRYIPCPRRSRIMAPSPLAAMDIVARMPMQDVGHGAC